MLYKITKKTTLACVLAVVASTSLLGGCASDIRSTTYTNQAVGEFAESYEGVIKNVRIVTVRNSEELEGNIAGGLVGGVVGGILGNTVGGGTGRDLATIGGVALGATVGSLAEGKLKEQQGFEYTVKLTDGRLITVVQGLDTQLPIGQKVLVQQSARGRSRVIPIS